MTAKTKVIGVRVDEATDARLAKFERETGVERVTLARDAMIAALDYYDRAGRISFPLVLVESEWQPIETFNQDEMQFVLIFEDGAMRTMLWNPRGYWEHPYPFGQPAAHCDPSHFMPLPEPPFEP